MTKLLFKLALLLMPFFIVIASVNYFVDPARLFHPGYEAKMAQIMLNGKNVKIIANVNDRILQMELIRRQNAIPDSIVIGGSKVMMVSKETMEKIFGSGKYLNQGMSQATLYDYIGVVDCYKKRGMLPKNILISADPHILSPIYENDMSKPFKEYKGGGLTLLNKNILELFSFSYFQNALKAFKAGERISDPVATAAVSDNNQAIKLSDGRRVYSKKVLSATTAQSNTMALKSANDIVKNSGEIRSLDPKKIKDFENMIEYLQSKGVKVVFFLPPYHPLVYKNIKGADSREIADKSEKWFISYASKHNIKVYGSYNPAISGCTEKDYFDNGHLRSEKVAKAFVAR